MSAFDLSGKVAIITGGNTGLGQGYAVALAEAGADIFIPTHGTQGWDATREMIEKRGRKVDFMQVDLTKPGVAQKVVDQAIKTFGHLDILINNAGMIKRNPILESKDADWDTVININLNAVYHMSMAAAKVFAKQGHGRDLRVICQCSKSRRAFPQGRRVRGNGFLSGRSRCAPRLQAGGRTNAHLRRAAAAAGNSRAGSACRKPERPGAPDALHDGRALLKISRCQKEPHGGSFSLSKSPNATQRR